MGGKSGGSSYTPTEHPDNLQSAQIVEIIDLLCEGEIRQDLDLKRVYLNDTPVQNADGTYNFQGVEFAASKGTRDQLPLSGFENTLRTVRVAARVKKKDAVVREVTDPTVSSLILTLGVSALVKTTEQGDRITTSVGMLVEFVKNGEAVYQERITFEGKTTSQYYADDTYSQLPEVPFSIRVSRLDADSETERLQNETYFVSYTEVINAKLSYPHSVVVGVKMDSAQFGNQIATRKYLIKGLAEIQIPDNYDPETRQYSGVWSGAFKTAWTDNPAWVFYDLVTKDRYGLGKQMGNFTCDKWALYQIAQYCDEWVDDGYGGREPRMTCNLVIAEKRAAYEILNDLASIFRGISVWNGSSLTVANDRVTEPVAVYTNANVVDGRFSRSFVAKRAIPSVVHVSYFDKREMYRQKTEYVADDDLIRRYGENVKSVTAYGCTSRGQALRFGRWILETARLERQTVTFSVGAEGLKHLPYDVIQISDKYWAAETVGGRVVAVSGQTVTLDGEVPNAVGGTLGYMRPDGTPVSADIVGLSADGRTVTLKTAPDGLSAGDVWTMIPASGVRPQLFRCLSIEEDRESGTYTVTAVEHNPAKGAMVDSGVKFSAARTSSLTVKPEIYNPTVTVNGSEMVLRFDSNAVGSSLEYEFTVYKDGKIYMPKVIQKSPEFVLGGLPDGRYTVRARARGDYGYSGFLDYTFTVDYNVSGLRTSAKTLAIGLNWNWPDTVLADVAAQIWYARENDLSKASLLATVPYPQSDYTLSGVGVADTYYFWVRSINSSNGTPGKFTEAVKGQADKDAAPIVEMLTGKLTSGAFAQSLHQEIMQTAKGAAGEVSQEALATMGETVSRIETAEEARAKTVEKLQAEIDGKLAAVTETKEALAQLNGDVRAMYSLKTESTVNGQRVITGLTMGTDGTTAEGSVLVYADRFGLVNPNSGVMQTPFVVIQKDGIAQVAVRGDLIADGTIHGNHIVAGVNLSAPVISGGMLNIGDGRTVISSDGTLATENAYVRGVADIKTGFFGGSVESHSIRGDNMRIYRMHRYGDDRGVIPLGTSPRPRLLRLSPMTLLLRAGDRISICKAVLQLYDKVVAEYTDTDLDKFSVINRPTLMSGVRGGNLEGTNVSLRNYVRVPEQMFILEANRPYDIWLICTEISNWEGRNGHVTAALKREFAENCKNFYAEVCYMSETDWEYSVYTSVKAWQELDLAATANSGLTAVDGGWQLSKYFSVGGVFGIEFEYYGESNRDWRWGLDLETKSRKITVKPFDWNHITGWTKVSFSFDTPTDVLVTLNKSQDWQWFRVRNLKVYKL